MAESNETSIVTAISKCLWITCIRTRRGKVPMCLYPLYPIDQSIFHCADHGFNEFQGYSSYPTRMHSYSSGEMTSNSGTPSSPAHQTTGQEEVLSAVTKFILLPLVVVLILICLVLGIILIVKSYRMKPLKYNLALAIRRSRQMGHAPDNQYVAPADVRASWNASNSENRKSLPPPEVMQAARERASQIYAV